MRNSLHTVLENIKPSFLQGTLPGKNYPETFFTYWCFDAPEEYMDNKPIKALWGFWVYCYSNDPETLETSLNEAIEALRDNGFIVQGRGIDLASDRPSHTGRMITVYYIETY